MRRIGRRGKKVGRNTEEGKERRRGVKRDRKRQREA